MTREGGIFGSPFVEGQGEAVRYSNFPPYFLVQKQFEMRPCLPRGFMLFVKDRIR